MTDDETIALGHRAEAELSLTSKAFEGLRAKLIEKWISTPLEAVETREKYHQAVQTIGAVQSALMEVVASGHVAAHARAQADLLAPAYSDRT